MLHLLGFYLTGLSIPFFTCNTRTGSAAVPCLSIVSLNPAASKSTLTYDGSSTILPKSWAPNISSPALNTTPYKVAGSVMSGSYSEGIFDYNWNFELLP